jgi:hypothetical protein
MFTASIDYTPSEYDSWEIAADKFSMAGGTITIFPNENSIKMANLTASCRSDIMEFFNDISVKDIEIMRC